MSAPPSGSASGSTTAGYYPDPSIPGYVRYWDGAAWVPGTSRPEPSQGGEPLPTAPGDHQAPGEPGDAAPAQPALPPAGQREADVPPPRTEAAPPPPPPAAPAAEPQSGGLPELRPRGDVDVPGAQPITDWDDPARLHGHRPSAAGAWSAETSQQSGFDGQSEQRVSWGSDGADPQANDPRQLGWSRPQAALPGEAPAVSPAPQPMPLEPAQQPLALPAQPSEPVPPAATNTPPSQPSQQQTPPPAAPARSTQPEQTTQLRRTPEPAQTTQLRRTPEPEQTTQLRRTPEPEQTTQLRRSDILKLRRAAEAARASQQAPAGQLQQQPAPPPQQPLPGGPPAPAGQPHSAPPGHASPEPGWQQQVRDLAQPAPAVPGQGSGGPGPDGGPAPWRPPAHDPFLAAAQNQARPAGLGRRFAARLIDSLLTAGVAAAVALPLLPKAQDHIDAKIEAVEQAGVTQDVWLLDGTTGLYLAMVLGAVLLFGVLCEALPNARWGRTLGKKILGLRVLSVEEQEPPGYGKAVLRWLVQGTLSLLVIGVVSFLWALFDKPWRQCWHDKAAGTFTAEGGGEVRLG